MMNSYVKLAIASLLPMIAAVFLYFVDRKKFFTGKKYKWGQLLYGVIFGILAIIGTEWGIPMNGAQVNCRDAAVLTAGLVFGAPAGIIAGLIGGIERWIAVAWGVGTFTRVACSVSTIIAGFYAAALRKFMFENKKPGWLLAFAVGVVIEVFHLTMVFITNMATPDKAMSVVAACTVPMIVANGFSVMFSVMAVTLLAKESMIQKNNRARISNTVQRLMLITVLVAFVLTSGFVYSLQTQIAMEQAEISLNSAINGVTADIKDASDSNMIAVTTAIKESIGKADLNTIAKTYDVAEINIVDKKGIIVETTAPQFIGYDMASGTQSAEFLCLLKGVTNYVQQYGPISYDRTVMRKYAGVSTDSGFIQVGYDAQRFQKDIDWEVIGITKNRNVGENGCIVICDVNGNIVSAPEKFTGEKIGLKATDLKEQGIQPGTIFKNDVSGETNYCMFKESEGYYIISLISEAEVLSMRNVAMYVNSFMEVLVFAILFALIYFIIKKVVVNNLKSVNESLSRITGGDLDEVVNVRSSEEFASLSDDINMTVDTLKRYIEEASARIDKELEFAKNIQLSALPSIFPAFPQRNDIDIYAKMHPAKTVGGDFYDFYITGNDSLNFLVADVSGKGIPAAMFMMRAKAQLKGVSEMQIPIGEAFTISNNALCEGNDAGMFVTAWQGRINLETGLVKYANAGHNPPLVRHADGTFEYVNGKAGLVLAAMEGINYKEQEIQLYDGDVIFLYTDGVTEATNANDELYGEERLYRALNSKKFVDMKELCEYVKADVDEFVAEAPQFDDITMLAFQYVGKSGVPSISFEEAEISDIAAITEFAERELEKIGCSMKAIVQFNIAIDEIYSNIVKYAYPDKKGPVRIEVFKEFEPNRAFIKFIDEGIPYNPLTKEDPDVTLSAEERNIGGLGIYIVKESMDNVRYKYENGQNILAIEKNL